MLGVFSTHAGEVLMLWCGAAAVFKSFKGDGIIQAMERIDTELLHHFSKSAPAPKRESRSGFIAHALGHTSACW